MVSSLPASVKSTLAETAVSTAKEVDRDFDVAELLSGTSTNKGASVRTVGHQPTGDDCEQRKGARNEGRFTHWGTIVAGGARSAC